MVKRITIHKPGEPVRWSAEKLREQLRTYTERLLERRDENTRDYNEFKDDYYRGQAAAYGRALQMLATLTLEEFGEDQDTASARTRAELQATIDSFAKPAEPDQQDTTEEVPR